MIKAFKSHSALAELRTHFEKKLEENPNNAAALEMIAEIYRNENQHEKAALAYQALCKAQPNNVRGYYMLPLPTRKMDSLNSQKTS